jgi:hypothetical protein
MDFDDLRDDEVALGANLPENRNAGLGDRRRFVYLVRLPLL